MKLDTHGLVMRNLRIIRQETCFVSCGISLYHALLYNLSTGEAWSELHEDDEPEEKSPEYIYRDDPDILFVTGLIGSTWEQDIADHIYAAVQEYKEKSGSN